MSTMLFYERIVPLSRERHRKLRVRPAGGEARFAAQTHYVPLAGTEFYQAARDYPVIFAGGDEGAEAGAVALLGLRERENLFVGDDGGWAAGTYVPAFVRRYPFVLARQDEAADYAVCIDESYEGVGEEEGRLLFDDDGNDTAYLGQTIEFLNRFLAGMEATRRFAQRLQEMDLLVRRDLRVTDGSGRQFALRDFRVVDEDRLAALDDAALGELHRQGHLGWIYAHLVSLGNISRLLLRLPPEPSETQAELAEPAPDGTPAVDESAEPPAPERTH